ncbi:MAG: hypothetical protein CL908_08880 [Deltaproteobacteria bacterium]|nr:hypothetical protein [Deltaproteobacteria bacterium]
MSRAQEASPAGSPASGASAPPLDRATRLWYALGQAAEGIKNESFALFLLFYYQQVLGLSGSLAGLAILIALGFDAVTDPLMGTISDRTRGRLGRRHPYLFASALPLGGFFYAVFAPPAGLSQPLLFGWMLGFTVLTRAAMTLFHVPHLSLGAELSDDYNERTLLVTERHMFQRAAAVVPGLVGLVILMAPTEAYPDGRFNPHAYPQFAVVASLMMVLIVFATAWKTRHRIPHLRPPGLEDQAPLLGALWRDVRELFRLPSFRALFGGQAISSIGWGVLITLGLHMATFFWKVEREDLFIWGIGAGVGLFAGFGYWNAATARTDKKPVFIRGLLVFLLFAVPPPVLRVIGWWPAEDHMLYVPLWVLLTGTCAHFGVASIMVTGQSMTADLVDEDEWLHGRRREGIFFGASSFVGKLTFGGGAQIAGWVVDGVGLEPGSNPAAVSAAVVRDLGLTQAAVLTGIIGLSILVFQRYRLTRERHAEIRRLLDERAAGAAH